MVVSHRRSPCRPAVSALAWTMVAAASLLACGPACAQPSPDIRLSRYTTASAEPEAAQVDPLEAVVQIGFPRGNVHTVGDAIGYLLLRSGYRMAPQIEADAPTKTILAMPLPEVHRRLGPYSVRTALSVLVGRPFVLSVDPMQRLVSYSVDMPAAKGSAVAGTSRTGQTRNGTGSDR
jgi:conjugative transfer region protein (TIGR03748 family)